MAAPTSRRPSALGEQNENSNGLDTRIDLSKQYFKLLQALHHLEILNSAIERESYPIGMTRQVDKLTSFIKPAAPNATILGKVASNTKAWLCNNVIALRDHYALLANTIQTELGMFQPPALERAIRWARARYGRKLTQSSLETLRSRLLITLGPPAAYHQQGSFKETNNSDSPWLTSEQQEATDWPAIPRPKRGPRTRPSHALKGKRKIVTLSASMVEIHRAATDMSLTPLITPIQSLTPHSPAPTSTNSPPQMHPLVKELLEIEEATHPVLNTSVEQSKTSITVMPPVNLKHDLPLTDFSIAQTGQQPTPVATMAQAAMYVTVKEESTQKMFQVNNCVSFTQLAVISQSSESIPLVAPQPPGPDYRTAVDTQLSDPAPLPGPSSPATDPGPPPASLLPTLTGPRGNREALINNTDIATAIENRPVQDPLFSNNDEPTRHRTSTRKVTDWHISAHKPTLLIGDSNLSRIPVFKDPALQADSYPGATMDHITEILRKRNPAPNVDRVVLALGLNNCLKTNSEITMKKCLQRLTKATEEVFPNADMYIPLINTTTKLRDDQNKAISIFNKMVIAKYTYLTDLNPLLFKVESDGVHWTRETAQAILLHWLDQLNM